MAKRTGMPLRGDKLKKAVDERLSTLGDLSHRREPGGGGSIVLSDDRLLDRMMADQPFVPEEERDGG